jgi:competence protein ComFC
LVYKDKIAIIEKAGMWYSLPAHKLYHLCWTAIDWMYPPDCGGCKKFGERWCSDCQNNVVKVGPKFCPKCGNFNDDGNLCPVCRISPPPYEVLRSWGIFIGPLREAIHRLKYQHDIGLGEALSKHLINYYLQENWKADAVVPIPLSLKRQTERGYNQAALLAWPMALALGIAYRPKAISRIRETRSQVGLKARERAENVKGAFTANRKFVEGKTILLIDDVTTTGATLSASARAMIDAGAQQVYGLTLARSSFGFEPDTFQAA